MSGGLLFLSSDDFSSMTGQNGQILTHSIQGFSLILFYSTQCEHCRTLIPIFKSLPNELTGCNFGMINVSLHREIISMARDTLSPIQYVPFIVLYIDGRPYMKYQGPHVGNEIKRFIFEVSQKVKKKARFSDDVTVTEQRTASGKPSIPEYTIGHPLCGKDENVTYLEFKEAYGENKR